MLSQDLFEAAPSNLGQDTLRQLQAIAASGQNADLKIGVEMMPLQPWQATYLMGVYKGIKQKYGVDKALSMLGNYDFVDHALAKQEEKLANMSRVGSIPGERGVAEGSVTKNPQPYNNPDLFKNLSKEKLDALAGPRHPKDKKQPKKGGLDLSTLRAAVKTAKPASELPTNDDVTEGGDVFAPGIENTPAYKAGFATGKLPVPHPEGSQEYAAYYKGVIDKATPNLNKVGTKEGAMPASVIRVKEKIRTMSDAEKREYFKGKTQDELRALARRHGYGADSDVYAKYATEKTNEDVKFPYPPRSEKLGQANFSLLIRAYNEPTGPRLTLNFGDRVIELDRDDVEAIADYYDNELKTPDARWNFIRIVMSDADNLSDVLRRLGRRSDSQQPGLFQEAKKKDDEELGAQTKDVALQRAITRAKADFPSAGSGIEALAKDLLQGQEQDQKSFDQLRNAERKQQQMLNQISKLDQRQDQEIDDLENANSALSQRIQQLQSVNSELEKKLASMSGRKSKAEKPAGITVIGPDRSAVATTTPAAKDTSEPAKQPAVRKPTPRRFKKSTGIPRIKSAVPSKAAEPARLTVQHPEILEPVGGRRPSPFSGQGDAVDVVSRMAQSLAGKDQATDKKVSRYSPPERIKKPAANDTQMEPAASVAETKKKSEADYGSDYQDMVRRVGKMAKQGPRKTVWDPVKRVYKTVPVNPPKDQGVAEGEEQVGKKTHVIEVDGKPIAKFTELDSAYRMFNELRAKFPNKHVVIKTVKTQ